MGSRFVDLGRKPMKAESLQSPSDKIYYPGFYSDKDLGLDDNDVGKEGIGIIKYKVKEVGKRITEEGKRTNSELEIMGINLKPKKSNHYQR